MLIRAGASAGIVNGEPRRELRTLFAAEGLGQRDAELAGGAAYLSPDDFPGRWNRRRAVAPELMPLPRVAAEALELAGWWRRGSGETCRGGLVAANDSAPVLASLDFTSEIGSAPDAPVRPAGFLNALPSTAASVLGLLFGLTDYQACVVSGALAGAEALRHALDLLELARLDRVLVASLSVLREENEADHRSARHAGGTGVQLAVALCLEAGGRSSRERRAPSIDCGVAGAGERQPGATSVADSARRDLGGGLPPAALGLASLPLLLVAKYCERCFSGGDPEPVVYHHQEPLTGGQASITLK